MLVLIRDTRTLLPLYRHGLYRRGSLCAKILVCVLAEVFLLRTVRFGLRFWFDELPRMSIQGSGFRGSGCRVQGPGCRVQGLGFRVACNSKLVSKAFYLCRFRCDLQSSSVCAGSGGRVSAHRTQLHIFGRRVEPPFLKPQALNTKSQILNHKP